MSGGAALHVDLGEEGRNVRWNRRENAVSITVLPSHGMFPSEWILRRDQCKRNGTPSVRNRSNLSGTKILTKIIFS